MTHVGVHSILDNLPDGVIVVSGNGAINFINKRATSYFGLAGVKVGGENIQQVLPELTSQLPDITGFLKSTSYTRKDFNLELTCLNGQTEAVVVNLKRVESGEEQELIISLRNLDESLVYDSYSGFDFESIRLVHQIATYANKAESFDDALEYSLKNLCQYLGASAGHIYKPDAHNQLMISSGIWYESAEKAFENFRRRSFGQTFNPGEGFIGEVWEKCEISWMNDIHQKDHFLRYKEANEYRLKQVMAVPVVIGDSRNVVAILEIFNEKPQKIVGRNTELVGSIAKQLAQVRHRELVNRQITEQDALFRQLFENASFGMIKLNCDHEVLMINRGFQRMFGFEPEDIVGKKVDELIANEALRNEHEAAINRINRGEQIVYESTLKTKEGKHLNLLIQGIPINIKDKTLAIFGMFIDITRQKQLEKEQQRALREKEAMLAEIHHRVKNNLAIIQAFLFLQTENASSDEARRILKDSTSRIYSIALAHEQLYSSQDFSRIQLSEYLPKLIDSVKRGLIPSENSIDVQADIEYLEVDIKKAIPIGLMVNELVTNSLKHAFNSHEEGMVHVSAKNNGRFELSVKDNGVGSKNAQQSENTEGSLGINIIRTLCRQLDAELSVKNEKGTDYRIIFELD